MSKRGFAGVPYQTGTTQSEGTPANHMPIYTL